MIHVFVCIARYIDKAAGLYSAQSNVVVRFRKIRLYMSVMRLSERMSYEDRPLVELMYLVFTRMPGESPQATQVSVAVLV